MKLLTYDGSGRKMKHALLGCVGCAPSKHKGVRTKSPAYDDEDEAEDTWLLMSSQPPGLANLPEDVLLTILECFPAKQAAVPLRAVCRAWRDLFNSSVHCITIHSNLQLLPQNPSRFPNLRHLCISQTNSTAAKAAVRMLGVPNCATLTMLEISNTWMLEPPLDLHKLTALKTLSITNCKMKSVMSAQLHVLPHLQALDLSSNNLEELPSRIGSLGTLTKLNVSDNTLTVLPEGLGGLTNLRSLRAANNVLDELPDSLVDLGQLTTLDVSLNRLKSLPDRLHSLSGLRQLGLFAAFSHSVRNEGSSTIRVLADMTLHVPTMHLHAEEVVLALVRMRKKQLAMAAAVEAARHAPPQQDGDAYDPDNDDDDDDDDEA